MPLIKGGTLKDQPDPITIVTYLRMKYRLQDKWDLLMDNHPKQQELQHCLQKTKMKEVNDLTTQPNQEPQETPQRKKGWPI